MSDESKKAEARRKGTWLYNKVLAGKVIDIGCGNDVLNKNVFPKITEVVPFDLEQGDANFIDRYFTGEPTFDCCHSSQNLEHLYDPVDALNKQFKILKNGGYIVASFPDFHLYEKLSFPSNFNPDHKNAFSLYHVSQPLSGGKLYNVFEMLEEVRKNSEFNIIKIELIDTNYDYSLPWHIDQTRGDAEAFIEIILQKI